jgi:hypothetical protein
MSLRLTADDENDLPFPYFQGRINIHYGSHRAKELEHTLHYHVEIVYHEQGLSSADRGSGATSVGISRAIAVQWQ